MKLLCFSDLHCDQKAATRLVDAASQVDCVIGAGDFAIRRKGLADTMQILSAIDKPAVLVPGNGESADELRHAAEAWQTAIVLHGQGCTINGVEFWGVGGGIPVTPFGPWSYDFDEAAATQLLTKCPEDGVLVVHSPPIDTVDQDSGGRVRGSTAIRKAVLEKHPKLVVCGHIHDDWEKQVKLGASVILNAGPRGIVVEVAEAKAEK